MRGNFSFTRAAVAVALLTGHRSRRLQPQALRSSIHFPKALLAYVLAACEQKAAMG